MENSHRAELPAYTYVHDEEFRIQIIRIHKKGRNQILTSSKYSPGKNHSSKAHEKRSISYLTNLRQWFRRTLIELFHRAANKTWMILMLIVHDPDQRKWRQKERLYYVEIQSQKVAILPEYKLENHNNTNSFSLIKHLTFKVFRIPDLSLETFSGISHGQFA